MKRKETNKRIVNRAGWVDLRGEDDSEFHPYKDEDVIEEDQGFCSPEFYEFLERQRKSRIR